MCLCFFFLISPVSSYVVGTSVDQGATVYIGENGLNMTPAQLAAYQDADGHPITLAGDATISQIGWWASAASIGSSLPTKTIDLTGRNLSFTVAPSDFVGYTGNWYLINSTTGFALLPAFMNVKDPSLDLGIWDFTSSSDVSGTYVPRGDSLGFRITTNLNDALNYTHRSPIYNTTSDGYIDIKVKNQSGVVYTSLLNSSALTNTLLQHNVSYSPWTWGNAPSAPFNWSTGVTSGGQAFYLTGNYSVYAESQLNSMKDNYKNGGADYVGKTVSQTYYIILCIAPVANFIATPVSGTAPLTVQFNETSTNTPTTWNWSFGDATWFNTTSSALANTTHTFSSAGTYTVNLTVGNSAGSNTSSQLNYIVVNVPAPVANFTGTPTSGTVPLTVTFTDSSLNLPTGWAWFFGDEKYNQAWTQQTASAGWSARVAHSSVVLPDGSIIVMGGGSIDGSNRRNDTWRSTDKGATWTRMSASSGWTARMVHSSVAMPDGSIVLMGGVDSISRKNDIWRSTDNGATWTMVNSSPGWAPRGDHRTEVMADGSIVLMGGATSSGYANDVWRSPDNGATWTQVITSGPMWSPREGHATVVMPDGSIVLMGGYNGINFMNDVWGSSDNGATWSQAPSPAGWNPREDHTAVTMPDGSIIVMGGSSGFNNDMFRSKDKGFSWGRPNLSVEWDTRVGHTSVAMPDGSIVLMGGKDDTSAKNDVWRFNPVGSTTQNPSHTYTTAGTYKVALQTYNTAGYNSTRKPDFVTVSADPNAPKVSFTSNVTSGVVPLTVAFNDTSTGSPVSWEWSFGDNTSSTEQNPVHTFQKPQVNNVRLKVANSGGLTNQTMQQIVVFGIKTDTNMALNGTTASTVGGKQVLAVNASTLQNTGGNVTTTSTILTMTGGNSFWTKTRFFADNIALNTTTGDYTVTNTTQVVMQSAPVSASLNKSIGDVSVSLDLALKQYVPDAVANITITEGATTEADNAFQQAAQSSSINIKAIAYTIQFTNTEQINANLTQNATRQSQAAILSMNINHTWVSQFATSTNNDGRDAIVIVRYPETGSSKVLTTRFNSYNSSSNLDAFEADSPDGLSIFGMIGFAAQEAASNSNSVSTSGSDAEAVNQQATQQIFKETAPLKTDTSNQLAADVRVQSIDKIALLTLSKGIRATDTFGQTLAEVSVLPMESSFVPPPEKGSQFRFDGLAYHCRPDHAQFSQPVTLTFTLPQDEWNIVYANNREPVIRTYSTSTNKWESLPTIADPAAKTVSTSVTHFSDFAIFSKPALNQGTATATPFLTTTPVLTMKPDLTAIAGNPSPTPTATQKTSKPPANAFEIMSGLGLWGSGLIINNPLMAIIGIIVIVIGYVGWVQYRKKKERDFIMYGRRK
ncbi:MAG: DUF3821 domain-containing protein [Methanoregula sp.]|nr:DUF3821 domain-containing protein [Methanoregula sp.]